MPDPIPITWAYFNQFQIQNLLHYYQRFRTWNQLVNWSIRTGLLFTNQIHTFKPQEILPPRRNADKAVCSCVIAHCPVWGGKGPSSLGRPWTKSLHRRRLPPVEPFAWLLPPPPGAALASLSLPAVHWALSSSPRWTPLGLLHNRLIPAPTRSWPTRYPGLPSGLNLFSPT